MTLIAREYATIERYRIEKLRAAGCAWTSSWIGHCAIQVLVRIWRIGQGPNEGCESVDFISCELTLPAQKVLKRRIEVCQRRAVAAPVQRFGADDAAQRLGGHRSLHRMKIRLRPQQAAVDCLHLSSRIAEVPGQSIAMSVLMATGA